MRKAAGQRGAVEAVADKVETMLQERPEKEIPTADIGAFVMQELKRLDKVAYVRFASVYRHFRDIGEFMNELKDLLEREGMMRRMPLLVLLAGWSSLAAAAASRPAGRHRSASRRSRATDRCYVSFELAGGVTDEFRETIRSGLQTSFVYDFELRRGVPLWVDRTLAMATVTATVQYDNLDAPAPALAAASTAASKRRRSPRTTSEVERWLTSSTALPLFTHHRSRAQRRVLRPRARPGAPAQHVVAAAVGPQRRVGARAVHVPPLTPGRWRHVRGSPAARPADASTRHGPEASRRRAFAVVTPACPARAPTAPRRRPFRDNSAPAPRRHPAARRRARRACSPSRTAPTTYSPDFLTEVVLYALSVADLTMLVALVFVLARNIIKLIVERRRALPFARFRAKLVAVLLGMTLIPSVLVLIVGSEVIRTSADRWFNAPMDESAVVGEPRSRATTTATARSS